MIGQIENQKVQKNSQNEKDPQSQKLAHLFFENLSEKTRSRE